MELFSIKIRCTFQLVSTAMNKAFVRTNEDKGIKRGNAKKSKFMK